MFQLEMKFVFLIVYENIYVYINIYNVQHINIYNVQHINIYVTYIKYI